MITLNFRLPFSIRCWFRAARHFSGVDQTRCLKRKKGSYHNDNFLCTFKHEMYGLFAEEFVHGEKRDGEGQTSTNKFNSELNANVIEKTLRNLCTAFQT